MIVEEIVSRLDAKRNGDGWQAKCPAHQDREPSLSIKEGSDGRTLLHCHAGCSIENVLSALGLTHRDLFRDESPLNGARRNTSSGNGSEKPHAAPFDWETCVSAFTQKHRDKLSEWRGYSIEFCSALHSQRKTVGVHEGCLALPVHDRAGNVVGAHCRPKDGKAWFYSPKGIKAAPLIIGELIAGDPIHVFESQWDAFAYMDKSGEQSGVIITRGASNGLLVGYVAAEGSTVYLWTQHDEPGATWERDICANVKCAVKRVKIPADQHDLNDWTRAGATAGDLVEAIEHAEVIQEAPRPLIEFKRPSELKNFVPPPGLCSSAIVTLCAARCS
jgi:hypothetical protein